MHVRTSRVLAVAGRRDGERIFRSAVRHSRLVRVLRIGIPLVIAGAVVTAAIASWIKPLAVLAKLPVNIGNLVISGTKITMQQPRMAGFTRDQRQYDMTAQAAAQDLANPDVVELQGIQAKMEMQDKAIFTTTANIGVFQTKTEMLTLRQNVLVTSSNGLKARLAEALVEIRTGKIVSEKPVEVTSPTLTINANRMEITESGDFIRFERGVEVTLNGEDEGIHLVSKAGRP
jgi:lipopolysaccharide export system protein LptC